MKLKIDAETKSTYPDLKASIMEVSFSGKPISTALLYQNSMTLHPLICTPGTHFKIHSNLRINC